MEQDVYIIYMVLVMKNRSVRDISKASNSRDGQTHQSRSPYETMPYIRVLHFVGVASGLTPTYSGTRFTASYDESMDSIPTNFHSTINCRLFGSKSAAFGPVLSHNFKQIDLTLPKFIMKITAKALLVALVGASIPKTNDAIELSKKRNKGFEAPVLISVETDKEIVDTKETLALLEEAVIMSCNDNHPKTNFHMEVAKVTKVKHSHNKTFQVDSDTHGSLRATEPTLTAVDDDDDRIYSYLVNYWLYTFDFCFFCRSFDESPEETNMLATSVADDLDNSLVDDLEKGKRGKKKRDDPAEHLDWEVGLCDLLGQMEAYAGARNCVITFE